MKVDSHRHKGMRRKLVEVLAQKGIQDQSVLNAINEVPRHFFFETSFIEQAYSDMAFRIAAGQTISQPYTVAFQTELLQIKSTDKVLEIGTGSGFQTAILCQLGAKVFSIERQRELHILAKSLLPELGFGPKLKYGDGYAGWPIYAPFDKIIVTCGAPYVPEALIEQLAINGRLVIPMGEGEKQEMLLITKNADGTVKEQKKGVFSFVPMLKNTAK